MLKFDFIKNLCWSFIKGIIYFCACLILTNLVVRYYISILLAGSQAVFNLNTGLYGIKYGYSVWQSGEGIGGDMGIYTLLGNIFYIIKDNDIIEVIYLFFNKIIKFILDYINIMVASLSITDYLFLYLYNNALAQLLAIVSFILYCYNIVSQLYLYTDLWHIMAGLYENFVKVEYSVSIWICQYCWSGVILVCLKCLFTFLLLVIVRVTVPKFKLETITKLGWTYSLLLLFPVFCCYWFGFFIS